LSEPSSSSIKRVIIAFWLLLYSLQSVSGFRRFGIFSAIATSNKNNNNEDASQSSSVVNSNASSSSPEIITDKNDEPEPAISKDSTSWIDSMKFEDCNPDNNDDNKNEVLGPSSSSSNDNFHQDEASFLDPVQLNPLLQIPLLLSLNGLLESSETPVRSFCDTAEMRTVMSWDTAHKFGCLPHLDRR
jgi:hypothetical protein